MRVAITYIFPENGGNGHLERAIKFVSTYHAHPPMNLHDTVIICNGARCTEEARFLFESLPNCQFLEHDDSGWDIGGFQFAARTVEADIMVFFGGNTYFRRAGWLWRMVQVYQSYGDGLYGCTGNQGLYHVGVFPHVRSTGFWCSTKLFNSYPHKITGRGKYGDRYEFEHGRTGLTTWAIGRGKPAWIVGWNDVKPLHECDSMAEGYHSGSQANLLVGDRLTAPPYHWCE